MRNKISILVKKASEKDEFFNFDRRESNAEPTISASSQLSFSDHDQNDTSDDGVKIPPDPIPNYMISFKGEEPGTPTSQLSGFAQAKSFKKQPAKKMTLGDFKFKKQSKYFTFKNLF